MNKRPNKSIPLSVREEEKLTRLAAEHGSYALTGPTAGMPSWRRMISEIAQGEFVIRRRKVALPPEDPPVEVEVVVPADVSPPLWWPREDDGSLRVYAEVSGERAKQCEAMGLDLEDLGFVAKGEWLVPVENDQVEASPPELP